MRAATMRCPQCSVELATQWRFCTRCGYDLRSLCQQCGSPNPAAAEFCNQCGQRLSEHSPQPIEAPATDIASAERRQVTAMFCDLVGFTSLSRRLDPEDLLHVVNEYRRVTNRIVDQYGGFVTAYQGDATLFCFGYPSAHDDDAMRATRAALSIVAGVQQLSRSLHGLVGGPLHVHVGIHTGEAIVGGTSDRDTVVGQVTNFAARLEGHAAAGSVLVSDATAQFLQDAFDLEALGKLPVKGLDEGLAAFRVLRERPLQGMLSAFANRKLTPLVGRDEEAALILKGWSRVLHRHGQVQMISGDPGIGKSRLVHTLVTRIAAGTRQLLDCSCLPHHTQSPLFPFIDLLRRTLGFEPKQSTESKLATLKESFAQGTLPSPEMADTLAALLLLPAELESAVAETSPQVQRDRVVAWFVQWILMLAEQQPVLLVVEDLHWADSYSIELLGALIKRIGNARVLLVLTFRPEFSPPWGIRAEVAHLPLARLSAEQSREIVESVVARDVVPQEIFDEILRMTEGNPLFVEEMVKAYLAHGRPALAPTLRGLFTARLDRLGSEKSLVHIAAVIERDFPFELIEAIAGIEPSELQRQLDTLIDAEVLFQRGMGRSAIYNFKHILLARAAYDSLLKERRAAIHRRVADAMVHKLVHLANENPEVVAQHYTGGGDNFLAAKYLHKAGALALDRSAERDAISNFRAALDMLSKVEDSESRTELEVLCWRCLGLALTAHQGYGAPGVEEAYEKARRLCQTLGNRDHLFSALTGLHAYYQVHGPLRIAREIAEQLLDLAKEGENKLWHAQAHRRLGWCLFCSGKTRLGREHLEQAFALYDAVREHDQTSDYGGHPLVVGYVNSALVEWVSGYPDRAVRRSQEALALAREVNRPMVLAYAMCMSAAVHQCRGEPELTQQLAEEVIEYSAKHGFPYWIAWGSVLLGWALAQTGTVDIGIERISEGLRLYQDTGAKLFIPSSLGLLADCYLKAGRLEEAMQAVEHALESNEVSDGYFYGPELYRIKAEVLFIRGLESAEDSVQKALALARDQDALSLELRALVTWGRIRKAQGNLTGIVEAVAQIRSRMTEADTLKDMREAQALLST